MKIKKDDIPKKKSGPDRQLALTPQNEATAKKAKGRPASRKKAEKLISVSPPDIDEKLKKENNVLLNELSVLKAELDIQNENLKDALLELETSRDKYRRLYNTTPVAYLTLDNNATVISANAASSELFGAGQRGLAGSAFASLVRPGAQDTFRLTLSKMLKTGEKQSCEIDMVKTDGTVFSAYVEIAGIADPGSVIDTVRAIVVDITERKRVEEALRESEERYRLLFENTSDGIYIIDRNFDVTPVTPNLGKLLGYSAEEMQGLNLQDKGLLSPESQQFAIANFHRVLAGEVVSTAEYKFVAKDGTVRYQDISGAPLVRDGKIVAAVCVARDITERKRAEEALKKSEEHYRLLFENTSDGIYIIDRNFNFTPLTPNIGKMLGYSPVEMQGKKLQDLAVLTPESLQLAVSNLQRVLAGEAIPTADCQFIARDGAYGYWDVGAAPLVSDGKIIAAICVARDITQRKLAEMALQASQEKYRTLMENANEGIAVVQDGAFKFFNAQFLALTGYEAGEIRNKSFVEFIFPEDRDIVIDRYRRRLKGEQLDGTYSFRSMHKSGDIRWVETNATLIEWEGKPATLNFLTDITKRKLAEESLRSSAIFLNNMVEQSPTPTWISDDKGTLIKANRALCALLQVTEEELVGKYNVFNDHMVEEQGCMPLVRSVFEKGEVARFGLHYDSSRLKGLPPNENTIVILDITLFPIVDDRGRITNAAIQLIDLTERKKVEEALKNSEEKYRTLIENASEGITIIQENGSFALFNASFLAASGYDASEIRPKRFTEFIFPEDRDKIINSYLRRLKGEQSQGVETFRFIHKSGEIRWMEVNFTLIEWEGKPATLNFQTDVTERKKAEEALQKERDWGKELLDVAGVMILAISIEGKVMLANAKACEILECGMDDIVGKNWITTFIPERIRDDIRSALTHFGSGDGQSVEYYENPVLTAAGQEKIIAWHNRVMRDEKGLISGLLSSGEDVTERKSAEENLKASNAALLKSLGDAVKTMSKIVEIRDPYTAGHQRRVAELSVAIAAEMGLDDALIERLRMAAIVHDIGKIYVPAEILSKPGKLSVIEYGIIKIHSEKGYEIVKNIDLPPQVALAILQHHERMDGSGYPGGLVGQSICIEARILAVADVVEAMSSHRPYRPARGIKDAIEEILKNRVTLYDPDAVDACVRLFMEKGFQFED